MTRTLGRGDDAFGAAASAAATFVRLDQNSGARTEDPADAAPAQERGAVDSDAAMQRGDGSHATLVGAHSRRPAPEGRQPASMKRFNFL
ncbi:hypothetical protein [Glycomyces salinus]|uniref:hypothetical protein n=1 Tax=Glycomyces salinus TaxID=980294 RepID=UPI0018EBECBC|nr:hypothetical protein [Glycomyces salinus]